jgi:hypothetical protein
MKKLILASIASLFLSSSYANAEWVKPTRSVCTSNGGKLENGICKANWQNAKDICRASGARLPTISELRRVITSCGGVVNDYENNRNDPDYQSCYQRRGFSDKDWYWSLTEYNNDSSNAWGVYFYGGDGNWGYKSDEDYALCVRGQ